MSTETMSSSSSEFLVADPDLTATGGPTTTSQLTPKGGLSKPSRRRSRATGRIPTTLLNANTTNFRTLVQQFTGCPSNPFSLRAHKGPVTLDFGGQHNYYHTEPNPPSVTAPLVTYNIYQHQNNNISQRYSQPPVTAAVQPQQLHFHDDHRECMYSSLSINHVDHSDVFLGGDKESNIVGDGLSLSMDDLASLHELLSRDSNFL